MHATGLKKKPVHTTYSHQRHVHVFPLSFDCLTGLSDTCNFVTGQHDYFDFGYDTPLKTALLALVS